MSQLLISWGYEDDWFLIKDNATESDICHCFDTLLDRMINEYNQGHYSSLRQEASIVALNDDYTELAYYKLSYGDVAIYLNRYEPTHYNPAYEYFIDCIESLYRFHKDKIIKILHDCQYSSKDFKNMTEEEYSLELDEIFEKYSY